MSILRFIRTRRPLFWIITSVVLAALVAGGVWSYKLCTTPERVFWGMIEQNLATSAVTVNAERSEGGTSADQTVQYSFGVANISRTVTHLTQGGTKVTNESVGTPSVDYTRYLSITTDQKTASGKTMDFSDVIGVWAKGEVGSGVLFAQSALGTGLPLSSLALPIGNLAPSQRQDILDGMHSENLFQVDFTKVKSQSQGGRKQYVYDVTMSPVAYAATLKRYAKAAGLHNYDELDPNSLDGQPSYILKLTVDVRSRRMVLAQTDDGSIEQRYGAYDVPVSITLPQQALPITGLQERITKAQQ